MLSPLILETSAAEELVIQDNLDVFQQNGFKLEYIDNEAIPPGQRIRILSLPYSKNIEFGIMDWRKVTRNGRINIWKDEYIEIQDH